MLKNVRHASRKAHYKYREGTLTKHSLKHERSTDSQYGWELTYSTISLVFSRYSCDCWYMQDGRSYSFMVQSIISGRSRFKSGLLGKMIIFRANASSLTQSGSCSGHTSELQKLLALGKTSCNRRTFPV